MPSLWRNTEVVLVGGAGRTGTESHHLQSHPIILAGTLNRMDVMRDSRGLPHPTGPMSIDP